MRGAKVLWKYGPGAVASVGAALGLWDHGTARGIIGSATALKGGLAGPESAGVEAGLKRAAELGDGFFPGDPLEGGWAATLDRMHGWAEAAGRDWSKFGISASVNAGKGTPDDWVKEAEEWRALGATHLSISTTGGHLPSPDGHIRRLREAKDALGVGQSHDG
jgi:hypothetical protein